jgi:large subunit ribosomal protein L4
MAVFDAASFEAPSTRTAADLLSDWGAPTPTLVILADGEAAAGKSFRNIARVEAMPVSDAGVADLVGAASLLVSEAALPALVERAAGEGSPSAEETGGGSPSAEETGGGSPSAEESGGGSQSAEETA